MRICIQRYADIWVAHQILQCFWIHSGFCHIWAIGVSAYMRCNVWHLHPVNVIVSADHMIKAVLPVHCHKWYSIIIVKQESAISIYGLLHFLSHFLSFRQGGHTADWNYSRPSNQPLKNWHVHDSKKEVPHHPPLLLLPLHTHLQVYQNCSLLEDLSIWSILFLL